jgi:hypothetical protein
LSAGSDLRLGLQLEGRSAIYFTLFAARTNLSICRILLFCQQASFNPDNPECSAAATAAWTAAAESIEAHF